MRRSSLNSLLLTFFLIIMWGKLTFFMLLMCTLCMRSILTNVWITLLFIVILGMLIIRGINCRWRRSKFILARHHLLWRNLNMWLNLMRRGLEIWGRDMERIGHILLLKGGSSCLLLLLLKLLKLLLFDLFLFVLFHLLLIPSLC